MSAVMKKMKGMAAKSVKKLISGEMRPKRRIKQTPPKSKFKGLTSSQIRKLKKEN